MVVVLFGGWVPFVLRPVREDVFELVGAAYVHGIMDGEWVQATVGRGEYGTFYGVWCAVGRCATVEMMKAEAEAMVLWLVRAQMIAPPFRHFRSPCT